MFNLSFDSNNRGNAKMAVLIVGLGVLVAAGLMFYGYGQNGDRPTDGQFDLTDQSPAAVVNGQAITKGRLNLQLSQLAANPQIQAPDSAQTDQWESFQREVLENLISEVLVIQAADRLGLTASQEELDQQYQMIVSTLSSEEELDQNLAELNMTRDQLMADLKNQIIVEKYIEMIETQEDLPAITDQEVSDYYDQWLADDPQAPTLEEIAGQIRMQIDQDRLSEILFDIVADLRAEAEVEILL